MSDQFKQVVVTEDGQQFDSITEAKEYLRRPKILEALQGLTKNPETAQFLLDEKEAVESAFDAGTVRRVTKSERNKLAKALHALGDDLEGPAKYLNETVNIDGREYTIKAVIEDSFKWPKQSRLGPEEKLAEQQRVLSEVTDNNKKLVKWIIDNEEALLEAYKAGIVKREVPQKTIDALAAYREKKAAEKAAAEAEK